MNPQVINPETYILSALKDQERLQAAFEISQQALKKIQLTKLDIEQAIKKVRKKLAQHKH